MHELANDLSFSDEENVVDEFDTKLIVNHGKETKAFAGINKSKCDFV